MDLNDKEIIDGKRWLILAGAAALALSIALFKIDNMLTYSNHEINHANKLSKLRTAQFSVASGRVKDSRLVSSPYVSRVSRLKSD